jgi:LysR family hydrogen peroxide-inducible transcriptional activator
LEISQIRYFVALCRALNFTRAARHCRVSQPSLSNGIMALERELGGPLFERSPIALTSFGRRLRPHLEAVLSGIERVHKSANGYRRARVRRRLAEARLSPGFVQRTPIAKDRGEIVCRRNEPDESSGRGAERPHHRVMKRSHVPLPGLLDEYPKT